MKGDGKDVLQRFTYFLIVLLLLSKNKIVSDIMSLSFWTWPQMFNEQPLYSVRPPLKTGVLLLMLLLIKALVLKEMVVAFYQEIL